jgi:hypothetical protein
VSPTGPLSARSELRFTPPQQRARVHTIGCCPSNWDDTRLSRGHTRAPSALPGHTLRVLRPVAVRMRTGGQLGYTRPRGGANGLIRSAHCMRKLPARLGTHTQLRRLPTPWLRPLLGARLCTVTMPSSGHGVPLTDNPVPDAPCSTGMTAWLIPTAALRRALVQPASSHCTYVIP